MTTFCFGVFYLVHELTVPFQILRTELHEQILANIEVLMVFRQHRIPSSPNHSVNFSEKCQIAANAASCMLCLWLQPLCSGNVNFGKGGPGLQARRSRSSSSSRYSMLPPVWYVYGACPCVLGTPVLVKEVQASRSRSSSSYAAFCMLCLW
jgi:hypothetical protein